MHPRALTRRVASWGLDYLVVLVWLAVVFVAVGIPQVVGWMDLPRIWTRPATADVAVTLLSVLPFLTYLVFTEAGHHHATFGKRRSGLAVTRESGDLALRHLVVRNAVKVLPWQLGHMSSVRFATQEATTILAVALFIASTFVLAAVVLPVLVGRRGLHDVLAGTAVRVRATAEFHASGPVSSR